MLTFNQLPEVRERYYAKIPVQVAINGAFHQVIRFFYNVGKLKRIVNIQNVKFQFPQGKNTKRTDLKANFMASTFRFLAKGEKKGTKKRR